MKIIPEKSEIFINRNEILDIVKLYLEREWIRYNDDDVFVDVDTVYDKDDLLSAYWRQELLWINIKNVRILL